MTIADTPPPASGLDGPPRLLLDTHAFIWLATGDIRVRERTRDVVKDVRTELHLSVASVWELAIKSSLGKVKLEVPLAALVDSQVVALRVNLLDVQRAHALLVEELPYHHRDPFDRMLVAQAIHEGLAILSGDDAFDDYPARRVW
jgi:PIN domain nuclease of toxin-antitoxin system